MTQYSTIRAFTATRVYSCLLSWNSWLACYSSLKWRNGRAFSKLLIQSSTARQPSVNVPRTRTQLVAGLPPIYPKDLFADIQRDDVAVNRILVVLDDDPTGTQSVHSVPVLADWSVQALIREVISCVCIRLDGYRLTENWELYVQTVKLYNTSLLIGNASWKYWAWDIREFMEMSIRIELSL